MRGPFHAGEIEVQRRAGLREAADRVGRIIAPGLPHEAGRRLLGRYRIVVAATVDGEGRPGATLLAGREGFLAAVDDDLVHIAAAPAPGDRIARDLAVRPEIGLLAFDPIRRRRLRLNGRGQLAPDGLHVLVDRAYGNCAKYIQLRRLVGEVEPSTAGPRRAEGQLSERQRAWVERSDTLFIASFHPEAGADASHRGGLPGFVRVAATDRLSFADYPGNAMFNTLGNLVTHPRVALLFVDFANGDLLEIAGEARVGTDREVEVRLEAVRETPAAMPLRYELVEYSPAIAGSSRSAVGGISRGEARETDTGDPT